MVARLSIVLFILLNCGADVDAFRMKNQKKNLAKMRAKEVAVQNELFETELNEAASVEAKFVQQIQLWGWTTCGWYKRAVDLANQLKAQYPSIDVQLNGLPSRAQYKAWLPEEAWKWGSRAASWTSSPFVVVDGNFIGGYTDFSNFVSQSSFVEFAKHSSSDKTQSAASGSTCSLYEVEGDNCGQSDLSCQFVSFAKIAQPGLKDGTCASQGYTEEGEPITMSFPFVGDITITMYTRPGADAQELQGIASADTCSLYQIDGDNCGQSDLNCQFVGFAKIAQPGLQDGTCESQGYTVEGELVVQSYPFVGEIVITTFTKPGSGSLEIKAGGRCSLYQVEGDECGESELDCAFVRFAMLAQPGLQDGTCADQGYTVEGELTVMSYPFIGDIIISKYTKE